jgi:hypothetical protein
MAYVTAEELQSQLEQLAEALGVSVKELFDAMGVKVDANKEAIAVNASSIEDIKKRLDAIDVIDGEDGIESIAEKLKTLNDMLSQDGTLATDLLQRVADNKAAINAVASDLSAEVSRAKEVEAGLDGRLSTVEQNIVQNTTNLDNLTKTVTANKTAIDASIEEINGRVAANEQVVENLFTHTDKDGNVVVGEVEKRIADANAAQGIDLRKYTDDSIGAAKTELENTLQSQIDSVEKQLAELDAAKAEDLNAIAAQVEEIKSVLNDDTAEDGTIVKGIVSQVADIQAQLVAKATEIKNAQLAADAAMAEAKSAGLATGVICGVKAANKFRAALGLPLLDENCGGDDSL